MPSPSDEDAARFNQAAPPIEDEGDHEEASDSALFAKRGRLKQGARGNRALAQKRGRLKHAVETLGAFARRFGRRTL